MKGKKRAKHYEPKLQINATLDEVLKIAANQGDKVVKERQAKKK
jgi:hypothetical protein